MIHYLLINTDGSIVQRGSCPTKEEIPPMPGCTAEIIEELDQRRPQSMPDSTYRDLRRMSYPGIGDQLDAIWKTLDGLDISIDGDAAAIIERIKAVKAAHPKA